MTLFCHDIVVLQSKIEHVIITTCFFTKLGSSSEQCVYRDHSARLHSARLHSAGLIHVPESNMYLKHIHYVVYFAELASVVISDQ